MADLAALPPMERRSLRCREADIARVSNILGLSLPQRAYGTSRKGNLHTLWLGPDEWLLLAENSPADQFAALEAALSNLPMSIVDISHRQVAFELVGDDVETCLASGCPLDLAQAAFPVGACARTLFHKAEIILWRKSAACFHIEVWRSFASYVEQLLYMGSEDFEPNPSSGHPSQPRLVEEAHP